MKKKVNYYKIGALVLLLVELGIAFRVDQAVAKESITIWRLYIAMVMCIPVNIMFICTKQTRKAR